MLQAAPPSASQPATQTERGRAKRTRGEYQAEQAESLTEAVLKLTLNSAQRVRELESATEDSWTLPSAHPAVQAMEEAGRSWSAASQALPRTPEGAAQVSAKLGPPHVQKWASLLRVLSSMAAPTAPASSSAAGGSTRPEDFMNHQAILKRHFEDIANMTIEQISFLITVLKVKSTRDRPGRDKTVRVILAVQQHPPPKPIAEKLRDSMTDTLNAVRFAFEAIGGVRQQGAPPPSVLERVVADQLAKRQGGKGGPKGSSGR